MHALQHAFTELPHLDEKHSQTGHATAYVSGGGGATNCHITNQVKKIQQGNTVGQQGTDNHNLGYNLFTVYFTKM
jgi:hypothetical protein